MELHVLGTVGYHPNESRHTTCLMIPELGIAFDAGTAFFRVRDLLQTDELNIFLTHAHLDHVVGLTYLLSTLEGHEEITTRVYGEPEKLKAIKEHLFHPALFPVDPPFESHPLTKPVEVAAATIRFVKLQHPGGSLGYRLEHGSKSLAFITDTTASPDSSYIDFIRNVDLLIHECNFSDGRTEMARLTGHSCLPNVCQVARAANVGRLLLCHLNPWPSEVDLLDLEQAKSIFDNCALADDRMVVEI